MRRNRSTVLIFVSFALLLSTARFHAAIPSSPEQRAIDFNDAAAWKGVNATALADRGDWFAYRLSPQEGDSTVTIRQTNGITEYKFSIGEIAAGGAPGGPAGGPIGGGGAALAISSDSKYAAFTMFPSHAEAAQRAPLRAFRLQAAAPRWRFRATRNMPRSQCFLRTPKRRN
jgi:hypothetical protein